MNITEKIIKSLGLMGYPWKVSTMLMYFLDENLKDIYGTTIISVKDINFTLMKNSMVLVSILAEGQHIISVDYNREKNVVTISWDKIVNDSTMRLFEITECPAKVENKFMSEDGVQKKFTYVCNNGCFGFEVSHMYRDEEVIDYKSSLLPMYMKNHNCDWFTYHRDYPPRKKTKSILKRIVYELLGKGDSRQIITSDDVTTRFDEFSYSIFGELIEDARNVLESNPSNEKIRIRI